MTTETHSIQKTKKPIWKRWWMIVLYVIVGIAVIANLSGGTDDEATAEEPTSEATSAEPTLEG